MFHELLAATLDMAVLPRVAGSSKGPVPDPALLGSDFNGFAVKDYEVFWSTGGIEIPNHKYQISNIKQITITKIVRASLGLPTLRAGPQFQNSKPVLVI